MNKKLNKKLLNLIALCSGLTATVALGVGGVVYSLRQEKDGGDEPVDQNVLPDSVYIIENNVLMGFTQAFLDNQDAYDMCDTMQIPKRVTSIEDGAFYNGSESTVPPFITKLTFADGSNCSSIGSFAFNSCRSISSITLSNNLSTINESAFEGCTSLTSVDFSNAINLSSIGNGVFRVCTNLSLVDLSNCANLFSIYTLAFQGCASLTSVSFPNSLKSIGYASFKDCTNLSSSINLSNCTNLSSIGIWAFCGCSSLVSITFPSNLSDIPEDVFENCSSLNSIAWDAWKGSTALESNTFSGVCPSGGTVTVTNPIDDDHNSTALLDYLLENGGLPESWDKNVGPELPRRVYNIDDNGVLLGFKTGIDLNKYKDICDTMEIPANVKSINADAFYDRTGLQTTIPPFITKLTFAEGSNCSTLGNGAFYGSSSLVSADLSNCTVLSSMGAYIFFNCSSLTSINLPNSIDKIQGGAFGNCSALKSINFPRNLTLISELAFEGCASLTSVSFPSNLSTLGRDVFSNCSNLSSITWEAWKGNTALQSDSFSGVCQDGGTVTVTNPSGHDSDELLQYLLDNGGLPESWRKIGPELPESCYDIDDNGILLGFKAGIDLNKYKDTCDTMQIPARVTKIADSAFSSSSSTNIPSFITNLTFAENSNCSSIGGSAFMWSKFNSVDLLNAIILASIFTDAFSYSKLTSIAFPNSLNSFNSMSFFGCSNLNYITWNLPDNYQTTISFGSFAFKSISRSGKVKSLNPSISSQDLLDWIKGKGDFPTSGWTVAC